MPIVSTSFESTVQADGSRNVIERYFDQDGNVFTRSQNVSASADIPTIVANYAAELSEQLAQQEFEQLVGQG
jgi:hypothetical protein